MPGLQDYTPGVLLWVDPDPCAFWDLNPLGLESEIEPSLSCSLQGTSAVFLMGRSLEESASCFPLARGVGSHFSEHPPAEERAPALASDIGGGANS